MQHHGKLSPLGARLALTLTLAACGEADEDTEPFLLRAEASTVQGLDGGFTPSSLDGGLDAGTSVVRDAGSAHAELGHYVVDVHANGTGCPPGSWITSVSADGQSIVAKFASYDVELRRDSPAGQITKNCHLAIKIHSATSLSFALRSVHYRGYAILEPGVQASQSTRYFFVGAALSPTNKPRTLLTGPYDNDWVIRDVVELTDLHWSPCGRDRDLNLLTTLQVHNSDRSRKGFGHIVLTEIGEIELAWHFCNGAPLPRPPSPPQGTRS